MTTSSSVRWTCSSAEVKAALGERIYLNPQKYTGDEEEGWELDEEYLSGNVKDKLAYAVLKAREHPDLFQRNVDALTRVQPAPLLPGDIDFTRAYVWTNYTNDEIPRIFCLEVAVVVPVGWLALPIIFSKVGNKLKIGGAGLPSPTPPFLNF